MKFCIECRYYQAPKDGLPAATWARCFIVRTDMSPVDGSSDSHLCDVARGYNSICGPDAKLFVARESVAA